MADAKDDDTAAVKPRRKKSKGAKLGRGSGWAPVIVATLEKYGPGTLEWLRFHMNARGRVAELERQLAAAQPEFFEFASEFKPVHDALNDAGADGIPLYSYSRAAIQSTHWDHDEENSRQVLEDWFIPGALEKIAGRERIEDHWDRLFFGTVYIWRGKNGRIDIAGHPYIKQMYPFITVGRADKDELQRFHGDRRVYLLSLFNEWAALLCGDDLKTAFSLERCVITSEYTHAAGLFQFSDIAVGGKPYKKFYLHREMIVGRSGDSVYTVMVGIPQPTLKDTEYHKHVHSWLKAFQLGREREVF